MPLVLNYAKANLIIKDNLYVQWNPLYHTHLPKSASAGDCATVLASIQRAEANPVQCKEVGGKDQNLQAQLKDALLLIYNPKLQ